MEVKCHDGRTIYEDQTAECVVAKCKYSETFYGIRNYITRIYCTDRKTDGERAYVKEALR